MGSVQPFLEGSFRSERARGFGSIQSEAVTRVGRIRSLEEVRKSFSTIGRRVIIFPFRPKALSRKYLPGSTTGAYGAPEAPGTPPLECVSGSLRIRNELRNNGAFAKRRSLRQVSYPATVGEEKLLLRGRMDGLSLPAVPGDRSVLPYFP